MFIWKIPICLIHITDPTYFYRLPMEWRRLCFHTCLSTGDGVAEGALYREVLCIMGNGQMERPQYHSPSWTWYFTGQEPPPPRSQPSPRYKISLYRDPPHMMPHCTWGPTTNDMCQLSLEICSNLFTGGPHCTGFPKHIQMASGWYADVYLFWSFNRRNQFKFKVTNPIW